MVALGTTSGGVNIPLGLCEGQAENAAVATGLLSERVGRGLHAWQGVICVLDGAKALRNPIRDVLGDGHEERSVLGHLPERDRSRLRGRLKRTVESTNPCKPMTGLLRPTARHVKRWQWKETCLRSAAAGMAGNRRAAPGSRAWA